MSELLQDWLRRAFPTAKQTTLRRMVEAGRVRVNGTVARRIKLEIAASDEVRVSEQKKDERKPPAVPRLLQPLKLVFEDDHLLVVEKPAGLLTSTVPGEKRPTALAIIREYVGAKDSQARVGLIHRLDRDASGLLVFSKSEDAYRSLKEQFFKHTVQRVYTAITHGVPTPPAGRIESRLVELPDGSVRSSKRPGAGDLAVTDYETVSRGGGLAVLKVTLQTGRKHQIRVHLSERGVPIVGDRVYGKADDAARLMLAATTLGFAHPITNAALRFDVAVQREFLRLMPSTK